MDLKVINQKNLKRDYRSFLAICIIITAGTIFLYKSGVQLFAGSKLVFDLKQFLLFGMIGVAFIFSVNQSNQKKKLRELPTVEEKISFYERFYRTRLWWNVFAVAVTGLLLLITYNIYFLYFLLFDLLLAIIAYPSTFLIKKEMNEQELIFIQ